MNELDYPTIMTASPAKQAMPIRIKSPQGLHVIILGNGFDIFLNRPTKYSEFYDSEYCPKKYPAPLIEYLNGFSKDSNGVTKDLRWYDFENQLLNYYTSAEFGKDPLSPEELQTIEEVRLIPRNLRKEDFEVNIKGHRYVTFQQFQNKEYIKQIGNSDEYTFTFGDIDEEKMKKLHCRDLFAFSLIKKGLSSYLKSKIQDGINESMFSLPFLKEKNIEVFTFNFTAVPFVNPKNVHYVHGSCANDNIIIGTREDAEWERNYWFLQKVFDPGYRPSYVSYALLNANKVSIFGHSLGINDRQYFQAFFKRQCDAEKAKRKMQIDIYTYDEDSKMDIKHSLQELTDFHLSDLYQYNTLNIFTEKEYLKKYQ